MYINKRAYDFQKLLEACAKPDEVVVFRDALEDAKRDFNLKTKKALLEFIHAGSLENLEYVNTTEWRNDNSEGPKKQVDAYEFRSAGIKGYFAFFYNPKQGRWAIKSFHMSKTANTALAEGLQQILLKQSQIESKGGLDHEQ